MGAHVGLRMRRLITFFSLAFAVTMAFAGTCNQYRWKDPSTPNATGWQQVPPGASPSDLCAAAGGTYVQSLTGCSISGEVWNLETRSGEYCESACAAASGQARTINVTSGWKRSNSVNASDIVIELMPDRASITADRCDAGCTMQFVSMGNAYVSQQPADNGLHRVSQDLVMVQVDTPCTMSPGAPNNPSAPAPACPGTLGMVNGKPVCVGSAGSPLPAHPPVDGTPPQTPGNPSAGAKPSTGPGSGADGTGRTPLTGSGGNGGGGSNASVPGGGSDGNGQGDGTPSGTGTSGQPKPAKDPCGIPGSAPCKIDETGTPNGSGAYDGPNAALLASKTAAIDGINQAAGTAGKNTGWSFSFSFPTACSPISLSAFGVGLAPIDVCQWQPMIHDLLSMVWIAATIFCCIGMVGRTVGGNS